MSNIHEIFGRIGNISVFDLFGTIGASIILSRFNKDEPINNFIYLFLIGEFAHILFKQETPIIKSLYNNNE